LAAIAPQFRDFGVRDSCHFLLKFKFLDTVRPKNRDDRVNRRAARLAASKFADENNDFLKTKRGLLEPARAGVRSALDPAFVKLMIQTFQFFFPVANTINASSTHAKHPDFSRCVRHGEPFPVRRPGEGFDRAAGP
jgi:hypothetical protein